MRKLILLFVLIGSLLISFCSDSKKENQSIILSHTIIGEIDISNRQDVFSLLYQIILDVKDIPTKERVEETAMYVRESLKKRKKIGIVMHIFLPGMDLEGLPYIIVQFRPRQQARLIIQNHALKGTRWQIETEVDVKKEPNKVSWANKQTTPKPKTTSKAELAYQLAVIDSGYVSRDDPSVAVFNRLLTKLDSYFIENRLEISDATVKAQELLKKEGIEVKLKVIMEGLQGVYPYKIENQKYLDILVYYMTFRKDFQSHSEAIITLKAIIIAIIGE